MTPPNPVPAQSSSIPIVVTDLSKAFAKPVLEGVNLKIDEGQIVVILGRSGTGKSVLLRLLIGLEEADSGTICLEGKEVKGLPPVELNELRKDVGFLFQQAALYDSMTILDNVAFPLMRHTDLSEEDRAAKAGELLAKVGLQDEAGKLPGQVSGGMKKRAGVARALALDPKILMLDEPTAGLDPITANELTDLIKQIRDERNCTCVIVTHDLHSARKLADHFVVLNEGKVRAEGKFEDLEASEDPFVKQYLKDAS